MAGPALKARWLLVLGVAAAHLLALDWFSSRLAPLSVLKPMTPVLYTRTLRPAEPVPAPAPVVAAAPAAAPRPSARVVAPRRPASAPAPEVVAAAPTPPEPEALPAAKQETLPSSPEAAPPIAETSPAAAASPAPAASAPAAPTLDTWPTDTRLSYDLGGRFRSGALYGSARVQWQREGSRYQVRIDIDISPWATLAMTSQGEVTPEGLQPRAFEEVRPGKRRAAEFGTTMLALENGRSLPRPAGVQDTASQFVELAHRFATGREKLEVGRSVSFWMARPGAVDHWTYDVVEREVLYTPHLGAVEAFRLKPRPIANPRGNITAEMWFAPSLQYLPVRIKVLMGEEAYVDLLVERIEQR